MIHTICDHCDKPIKRNELYYRFTRYKKGGLASFPPSKDIHVKCFEKLGLKEE